ncbi:MAG: leucine-rich repeat domain-containing protein, partial [Candidatus Hinthialibacter sp.]
MIRRSTTRMRRIRKNLLIESMAVGFILILLLFASVPKFLRAQNINTPANFPDPKFREIVEKVMGVEPGGRFYAVEAAERTGLLECSMRNIEDLKGIEFFPNLSRLHCSQNKLRSLDLSNNAALEILRCNENRLTELDLSRNFRLKEAYCNQNRIQSIILKNNDSFLTLACLENEITALDLRQAPNLQNLYCAANLLGELDLSESNALEELDCSRNRLAAITLKDCPHLKAFSCSDNLLRELDLSSNAALESISCASNFLTQLDLSQTSARFLDCRRNQIAGIRLSEKSSTHYFQCSHNKITAIDPLFRDFKGVFPAVFDIRHNDLSIVELDKIRAAMKDMRQRGITIRDIHYWPQNNME